MGARQPAPQPFAEVDIDLGKYWDGVSAAYAGMANVALQMLGAPGVAYGVMESKVESGRIDKVPFKRARTTFTYLAVAVLGDDDDRAAYAAAVNEVHRQVRSTEASPVRYNAFDTKLQLWVAACLYYGFVDTWEHMHGPMDEPTAERAYQQLASLGTTLQMPREMWPESRAAFDAYWRKSLATADLDERTKDFVKMLMGFEMLPWWLWPGARFLQFMNTGYLPWQLREQLGLTWTARHQAVFSAINGATGRVNDHLPGVVRNFPFNFLLWDMRRRRRAGRPLV